MTAGQPGLLYLPVSNKKRQFLLAQMCSRRLEVIDKGDNLCQQGLPKQSDPCVKVKGITVHIQVVYSLEGLSDFSNNLSTMSETHPFLFMEAKFLQLKANPM